MGSHPSLVLRHSLLGGLLFQCAFCLPPSSWGTLPVLQVSGHQGLPAEVRLFSGCTSLCSLMGLFLLFVGSHGSHGQVWPSFWCISCIGVGWSLGFLVGISGLWVSCSCSSLTRFLLVSLCGYFSVL